MHANNISALMAHVICKGGVYNCILIAVRPPGKICPSHPKSGGYLNAHYNMRVKIPPDTHIAICCFVIGAQTTNLNTDYSNYIYALSVDVFCAYSQN